MWPRKCIFWIPCSSLSGLYPFSFILEHFLQAMSSYHFYKLSMNKCLHDNSQEMNSKITCLIVGTGNDTHCRIWIWRKHLHNHPACGWLNQPVLLLIKNHIKNPQKSQISGHYWPYQKTVKGRERDLTFEQCK